MYDATFGSRIILLFFGVFCSSQIFKNYFYFFRKVKQKKKIYQDTPDLCGIYEHTQNLKKVSIIHICSTKFTTDNIFQYNYQDKK